MTKEKLEQLGTNVFMAVIYGSFAAIAADHLIGLVVPPWIGAVLGLIAGVVYTFARDKQ